MNSNLQKSTNNCAINVIITRNQRYQEDVMRSKVGDAFGDDLDKAKAVRTVRICKWIYHKPGKKKI